MNNRSRVAEQNTTQPSTPGTVASFARFVVFGGGTGLASSAALVALSGHLPIPVANAIVTVAGTILATELHSRFAFRAGRADLKAHFQAGGSAAVAYLFTTAAMLGLHAVQAAPSIMVEQGTYLVASGIAGLARFVFLRLAVFAPKSAGKAGSPTTVTATRTRALGRDALVAAA
ncbi:MULTISPECIES: GtrA family protein [unclassified Embleya]|uniref:GtrA family protein n=1 Tax=unclassified Embleya TaxID=2699296 RepID=UPI003687F4D2